MRPQRTSHWCSGFLWMRPRSRTRSRYGKWPHCWQDVNYSSHSSKAVQGAKIVVHARLHKSELIHEARVVKSSRLTVHVIRGTKLPIFGAWRATGDTVKIALPGPAHCVAYGDVDHIRQKTEFVSQRSHGHIKNIAPSVWLSTRNLASVLIDDADCRSHAVFRCRVTTLVVSGFGGPCECCQKQHCEPPRLFRPCLSFCDHSMRRQWDGRADPQPKISGALNLNRAFHPHLMLQECRRPQTVNRRRFAKTESKFG